MGKVLSLMTKPIREFNIESRAHAIIGRDKPTAAPKFKSDMLNYERMLKEHPQTFQESMVKHEALNKYLKKVYLTSHDPLIKLEPQLLANSERPLPLNRSTVEDFEYGFHEPKQIPVGKVTLRKALRFISEHNADPTMYSSIKIAADYTLPVDKVRDILKHFRIYEIYIPQQRKIKATFAGPSVPRPRIHVEEQKKIQTNENKKKQPEK